MPKADEFRKRLQARGLGSDDIDFSVRAFEEFEEYLKKSRKSFESMDLNDLKRYVSLLIKEGRNSQERLNAVARCLAFAGKNDVFIYLVGTFGASNVLPDIGDRLASIAGEEVRRRVFEGFELPVLGSPQDAFPPLTEKIMRRMEAELPSETCREVLTWNYHKVPAEAFKESKERFEKADSIDDYLKDEHRKLVEELEEFAKEGRVWFEQEIAPKVVEFVRGNQEICTGVRQSDKIYVTKIPYAPKQYLAEKDPILKRYYACHCQLVRTSIRDGKPRISPNFCYCSAGFEKVKFDAVFGEPVKVELLESLLKGDMRCRFAIKIPERKMK